MVLQDTEHQLLRLVRQVPLYQLRRLANRRGMERLAGASQPGSKGASSAQQPTTFTRTQLQLLDHWDTGILRKDLNEAVANLGHGRLRSAGGNYLDIGGSTGGGSRRIIDGWVPPDWRQFLEQEGVGAVHSHCGSTARSQGSRPEAQ